MGVDFGPYLAQVVKTVKQNWYGLMPPSVYPPTLKQGMLSIEFVILKDGRVSGMTLQKRPGIDGVDIGMSKADVELDRAAWASITASNPFAALPKQFPGQTLGLRFHFYYNPQSITISPSVDVRVTVGSTQQFSASGKGTGEGSVAWNVSGPGCSKSPCGTISDNGLYTAPLDIPNPPTVFVEATARIGVSLPAKAKLTVVETTSSR